MASKLATQLLDDIWSSQRQMEPIRTEVTLLAEGGDAGAGDSVSVDWNSVEIAERTDLIIAPMDDIEMAKLFGIPVDERDEEKDADEDSSAEDGNIPVGNRHSSEDVDRQLMEEAADLVNDAHDEELVTVYDKENPEIGRAHV